MSRPVKWRFWAWPWELRRSGVLGINRRNADYVLLKNPRRHYLEVDDKLITKTICEAHGISVPETYAVIERYGDIRNLLRIIRERREFVVKPARGAAGRGIVVVADHDDSTFHAPGGGRLSWAELRYHVATILSGLYSLGGRPDKAIIEQRILQHPAFDGIAVGGTPDVRMVMYRGAPAMAMIRLPTKLSGGRANLHQGAVGAGIDRDTGKTVGGVCWNRMLTIHPDTGKSVEGIQIPGWRDILEAAARLARSMDMGYIGIDFVVDANLGPIVLEANARPGLAIQIANRKGLQFVLDAIEGH